MKEYTLVAELYDNDGGEWSVTLGYDCKSDDEAVRCARTFARAQAKEQGAKVLAFCAVDAQGICYG